jgi:spore maturation protein CgeB
VRFVLFYHSLISDWNHGNAHFLRGVASELIASGHTVRILEPANGWSLANLIEDAGLQPVQAFHECYPRLSSTQYDPATLDLDTVLGDADVVIVHEWNEPRLVNRIGRHRAASRSYVLLFHDTHHRAVSAPQELRAFDLTNYDGVLVFGEVLRHMYEDRWAPRAWTWHEAADTRIFRPPERPLRKTIDLAWIGNWGDGERAAEIREFLIEPVRALGLRARIYGVRYPPGALDMLRDAGIEYAGWVANFRVPGVFAHARTTVHIPRAFYRDSLPGIPTIRVFEALACGIPLVSAPWDDCEQLFEPGRDFLIARDGREMRDNLRMVLSDPELASALAQQGLATIRARHTCAHRARELLAICAGLGAEEPLLPLQASA